MPYVPQDKRSGPMLTVGDLTYQLQQVLNKYLLDRCVLTDRIRYHDLAACLGALEGCKADFIERILLNYEENVLERNGDVWSPQVVKVVCGDCGDN